MGWDFYLPSCPLFLYLVIICMQWKKFFSRAFGRPKYDDDHDDDHADSMSRLGWAQLCAGQAKQIGFVGASQTPTRGGAGTGAGAGAALVDDCQ